MTDWSPQQSDAIAAVSKWFGDRPGPQVFRLFGFAGTGKTTLARAIAGNVKGGVAFGAFTGNAAHVMRQKGCAGAATLHSLIYELDDESAAGDPKFRLNPDAEIRRASLIIVDEVSMVNEQLGRDLLSFGVKVLVLGDPAQLPPVDGGGFFTAADPNVMLTEVHRQAADSPIIRMATTVRQGGRLELGPYGDSKVITRADCAPAMILGTDQIIVGLNKTRHSYNARIRELNGRTGATPEIGEKLVCVRNDREKRLLNGSLWIVQKILKPTKPQAARGLTRLVVSPDDNPRREVEIIVKSEFWTGEEGTLEWRDRAGTQEFTYGYALTCHKCQGSQWDNIVLFDQSASFRDDARRWLYTGLTRAAKTVTVVLS